jgi:hypothetical protein
VDEMALNGVLPDLLFYELATQYAMRSTRVGDCFFYYEEMKRRGMQPGDRVKAHLVSVLARHGDLDAGLKVPPPDLSCSAFAAALLSAILWPWRRCS